MSKQPKASAKERGSARSVFKAKRVPKEELLERMRTLGLLPQQEEAAEPQASADELLARLKALGHDPVAFLTAVVAAEEASQGKTVAEALQESSGNLLSPSVLVSVLEASRACRHPQRIVEFLETGDVNEGQIVVGIEAEDASGAWGLLESLLRVLRSPDPELLEEEIELRKARAFEIAIKVQDRAMELAKQLPDAHSLPSGLPNANAIAKAWSAEGKARGRSIDSLRREVSRCRAQWPDLPWPPFTRPRKYWKPELTSG